MQLLNPPYYKLQHLILLKSVSFLPSSGLKDTTTGDTLCDPDNAVILERMEFPKPVIKVRYVTSWFRINQIFYLKETPPVCPLFFMYWELGSHSIFITLFNWWWFHLFLIHPHSLPPTDSSFWSIRFPLSPRLRPIRRRWAWPLTDWAKKILHSVIR